MEDLQKFNAHLHGSFNMRDRDLTIQLPENEITRFKYHDPRSDFDNNDRRLDRHTIDKTRSDALLDNNDLVDLNTMRQKMFSQGVGLNRGRQRGVARTMNNNSKTEREPLKGIPIKKPNKFNQAYEIPLTTK